MSTNRNAGGSGYRTGPVRPASTPDIDATIRKAQRPGNQGVALTPEAYSKVLRALMTGDDERR